MPHRILFGLILGAVSLAAVACYRGWSPAARAEGASDAAEGTAPPPAAAALPSPTDTAKPPRPEPAPVADPIIVPDCRLSVIDKQEVPSQRDGVLLLVGTEVGPDEPVAPERRITIKTGNQEKTYRRLVEGDAVEAGWLVALLDDGLARDDRAIRQGRVVVSEAELAAAEHSRDEAKERYLTQMKLHEAPGGPATSAEDLRMAKLVWYRGYYEAITRQEALKLARLELHQAETVLGMYEIHSTIAGVIRRIHKHPGEAVRSLEPVLEIRDPRRLRVEGLVGVEFVDRLHTGMKAVVQPSRAQAPVQVFQGHLRDITGVAVGQDQGQNVIVSGSEDGTVRVWSRNSRQERRVLRHPTAVRAVACSRPGGGAGKCLAGLADGSAQLWDLHDDAAGPLRLTGGHHGALTAAAFSPDGSLCVTGGEDRAVCLWQTVDGALRCRFPAEHGGPVTTLHFPRPDCVISAGRDNTVRVWTVGERSAALETTLDHRSGDVPFLGVSPDGKRVLFDQGNALHVITLPGGQTEATLHQSPGAARFTSFALFAPGQPFLVTAGAPEGRLQLWPAPGQTPVTSELCQLVAPDRTPPVCAAFAPDGSFLVAATRNRQILVWPVPAADADRRLTGRVTLVEHAVESSARQVRVWVEVPNPDDRLLAGTTATMTLFPEP